MQTSKSRGIFASILCLCFFRIVAIITLDIVVSAERTVLLFLTTLVEMIAVQLKLQSPTSVHCGWSEFSDVVRTRFFGIYKSLGVDGLGFSTLRQCAPMTWSLDCFEVYSGNCVSICLGVLLIGLL